MIYQLYTTVDITETKVYHGPNQLAINQQQNFNTVIQTIGLCGNIYYDESPSLTDYSKFNYTKCWLFEWNMEIPDIFKRGDSHVAILYDIFQYVPFIANLTEEVPFNVHIFSPWSNIFFDYKKPRGI